MQIETALYSITMLVASLNLVAALALTFIRARTMQHVVSGVVPAIGAFVFALMSLLVDDGLKAGVAQIFALVLLGVSARLTGKLPPRTDLFDGRR
jgi:VIT1/CCC1 family predicted Fe2+/Mn2+ transporter